MHCRRNGRSRNGRRYWIAGFALAVALCAGLAPPPATAEVQVSGSVAALKLEAKNASLDEVLAALRRSYKFDYRSAQALGGSVSGTYSGSLQAVVTRLLEERNFVIHTTSSGVAVSIFTSADNSAIPRPVAGSGPEPRKDCKYNDGVRIIPVEC
jgi:hypothetical protein